MVVVASAHAQAGAQKESLARPEEEPNTQIIFANPDSTHTILPLLPSYDDMSPDMKNLVQFAIGADSFKCPTQKQAIILHLAKWRQNPDTSFALISNEWYVYHTHQKAGSSACALIQAHLKANGDQRLNGDTDAILIGLTSFLTTGGTPASVPATVSYKASATPAIAQNIQDLTALISAVTGISANAGKPLPQSSPTFVAAGAIAGYRKAGKVRLPFVFNLSYSVALPTAAQSAGTQANVNQGAGGQGGQGVQGGGKQTNGGTANVVVNGGNQSGNGFQVTDCTDLSSSKSPCSSTKTFTSEDSEAWDVSVGIAVPGVPELVYGSSLTTAPKIKWHTDFYGFIDIFPFAKLVTKESAIPHIIAGIPLTSQPLHRSSYGISEDITSWTGLESHGFPVRINAYAAIAYEKVQYLTGSATGGNLSLKPGWTLKPNFGVEVPISSILSKLSSKSKSSSTKNASSN